MSPKTIPNYIINKIIRQKTEDRYSIKEISQNIKLARCAVSKILKNKLKDTRSKYSTTQTYISKENIEEIVQLRKKNILLRIIHERLKIPVILIISILKGELRGNYQKYGARHIPYYMREQIFHLYELKTSPQEISEVTKVSLNSIKVILQKSFDMIYNKIISEIQPVRAVISMYDCHSFYLDIYNKIKKGSKYRDSLKLTPITIFFYLKSRNVFITTTEFINAANMTREEFRKDFKAIYPFCGSFTYNNHKAIIYSLIIQIQEKFNLPDSFNNVSRDILNKFGHLLMNTKPEITAGVVSILSLLKLRIHSVRILTICETLGFQMSTALYQVKNSFLKRMGIEGFQGFKKTPNLIEPLLQNLTTQTN